MTRSMEKGCWESQDIGDTRNLKKWWQKGNWKEESNNENTTTVPQNKEQSSVQEDEQESFPSRSNEKRAAKKGRHVLPASLTKNTVIINRLLIPKSSEQLGKGQILSTPNSNHQSIKRSYCKDHLKETFWNQTKKDREKTWHAYDILIETEQPVSQKSTVRRSMKKHFNVGKGPREKSAWWKVYHFNIFWLHLLQCSLPLNCKFNCKELYVFKSRAPEITKLVHI